MQENTERFVHTQGDTVVARLPETGSLLLCEKDGISVYFKEVFQFNKDQLGRLSLDDEAEVTPRFQVSD